MVGRARLLYALTLPTRSMDGLRALVLPLIAGARLMANIDSNHHLPHFAYSVSSPAELLFTFRRPQTRFEALRAHTIMPLKRTIRVSYLRRSSAVRISNFNICLRSSFADACAPRRPPRNVFCIAHFLTWLLVCLTRSRGRLSISSNMWYIAILVETDLILYRKN